MILAGVDTVEVLWRLTRRVPGSLACSDRRLAHGAILTAVEAVTTVVRRAIGGLIVLCCGLNIGGWNPNVKPAAAAAPGVSGCVSEV